MTSERVILTETFDWRGISVSVEYEPDWLGAAARGSSFTTAHLVVQSIAPDAARLPITRTGYRSRFLAPGEVEGAGGPAVYVRLWLDHAAQSREWQRYEAESRQLTLF